MSARQKNYKRDIGDDKKDMGDMPQQKRNGTRTPKFDKIHSSNKPATQFFASLLTNSSREIAASRNDDKTMVELMHGICERAGVALPSKLPLTYRNSQDYFYMQASLVLEESRFILAEILCNSSDGSSSRKDPLYVELVGMEAPKKRKVGFTLQFENRKNGLGVPFREDQMIWMRPGGVFEVSYTNSGGYTPAQNETVDISMLACVTPGCYENDHCHKNAVSLTVFPTQQLFLRQGTTWRIHYLTTLISEQRQFEACMRHPKVAFMNTLLGWKTTPHARSGDDDDVGADRGDETIRNNGTSALETVFSIPTLNTIQEKTAIKFLQSPPSSITLVQGPPGTGKTTFIATLLCRNLCSVRNDGSVKIDQKKRILVTAPTNKAVIVIASRFLGYMKNCMTLNIVMIGVENKLVAEEDGNNGSRTHDDPFTAASLCPTLRSIFVYTWLDEMIKEILSFSEYLQISSYTPEKRRILISRASVLARRLHSSLPCIVEKTGSLYWAQELVASLQRLPTDLSTNTNTLMGKLTQTKSCIKDFVDILDQINRSEANQELLDAANIIFCTLSTAGVAAMKRTRKVNDIFVDEAAAATEPEILIPLHLNPERMLAVGDPKQLPATLMSRHAIDCGLDKSLIDRLMFDCSHEYVMLNTQYRMHPEIRSLPSQIFYKGKIVDGDNVLRSDYRGKTSILDGKPYSFFHVQGSEERSINHSYHNMKEAQIVVEIVKSICYASQKMSGDGYRWYTPEKLRIITFYGGQVSCIRRLLANNGLGKVTCATVDSCQGCEADIVIISFVRSNKNSGITHKAGFLQDERRINVALTRAKFQLICIGDAFNTLSTSGVPALKAIVDDASCRGFLSDFKSSNTNSVFNKLEENSNRNHNISSKKEYTGYVKEPRQWSNSDSFNSKSDYKKLERKNTGNDITPLNAASPTSLKNTKVYAGYVEKKRQWSNSVSSDTNSDFKERRIRNQSTTSDAKVYTGYVKEPRTFTPNSIKAERKSMGNHNSSTNVSTSVSALAKERTAGVDKSRLLNNSNSSNCNLDYTKREPKEKRVSNHSTPTTMAGAREYTGYTTEHKKNQDSHNHNQHNGSYNPTEKPSHLSQSFQDEISEEKRDARALDDDQFMRGRQTDTSKNRTPFTQTEKDVIKTALLEKIAFLQKQVEKIDEL